MDFRAIGMGLAFAFMWASAFSSARIIVTAAPPLYALSLRFLISGLVAVGVARLIGQSWSLTPRQWKAVVVFGICQNAMYLGLNFIAMQWVEASLAAIIATTMPLIVAGASWVLLGERLTATGTIGLFLGFLGVSVITLTRMEGADIGVAVGLCVLGVIALSVATMAMKTANAGKDVLMIVGLQMLVGMAALIPFALIFETWRVEWSGALIAAFWYTVLIPGLAATWVWFRLVQRIGATRGATYHFLTPFFGVAVAALLLGERMGWADILGVIVITLGIFLVQTSRQRAR